MDKGKFVKVTYMGKMSCGSRFPLAYLERNIHNFLELVAKPYFQQQENSISQKNIARLDTATITTRFVLDSQVIVLLS